MATKLLALFFRLSDGTEGVKRIKSVAEWLLQGTKKHPTSSRPVPLPQMVIGFYFRTAKRLLTIEIYCSTMLGP
jgi:hypothetical protein